jgi:two-component system, NarL family, sensor histidine kinase UhpB
MTLPRRDRLGGSIGLVAAAVVTALLLACAAVLRLSVETAGDPLPDRLVSVMFGAALLLVGLLAVPRVPGFAWALIAFAAPLGTLEIVGVVRPLETVASGPAWRDLALIASVALVGAVLVDGAYAGRNLERASRPARVAVLVVSIAVLVSSAAAALAILDAGRLGPPATADELTPLRIAIRLALVTVVGAYLVGAARSLAPAAVRAAERSRREHSAQGGALWRYLGQLADELVPARSDARREAAEAERARLAADLHAHVLPELRRAAAAASSAGVPPEMQVDLRRALEDVEQLMHQRQSIVLEQFGLVAALEWLAERTEERSALRVHLDLEGAVPDGPAAIDGRVARAAFRISLLGLDNVVRHAGATTATLRLSGDASGLRLTVADDGSAGTLEESGGRGIPDMRTAATESGGTITYVGGTGARIEATWPVRLAARNHAPARAPLADRSEGPAT